MRINSRFLNWGLFFILVGAVPLAVRGGVLTAEQVGSWWSLWPLIIVGIGVGLILGRTSLEFLGGLIVAGTFGLMLGALFAGGGVGFPGNVCGSDVGSTPIESRQGAFGGPASVEIQLDCGLVEVTPEDGTGWSLEGTGDGDRPPRVSANDTSLSVRSGDRDGARFAFAGEREHWELRLPVGVPYSIDLQLNAGEARIRPGAAELGTVNVQFNAASVELDLSDVSSLERLDVQGNAGSGALLLPAHSLQGQLQVNAGSIEVCTPQGAALRLTTGSNPIGSYDLDGNGLDQNGNTWQTPGYDSAAVRIALDLEANVGSISLNPEDGCDG